MSTDPLSLNGVLEFPGIAPEANDRSLPGKFRLEDFDTLEAAPASWRVKGLWPSVGVVFVGGPSMSGKSFWTLDALAKVCRGEPVLGRKSVKAGVVYVAAEGANGVRNRIKTLRESKGFLGGCFNFIGQAPDLTNPDDVLALREALVCAKAEMESRGAALGVVAIDTLSAAIPGADENSAQDMSRVLADLQGIAGDLGILVLVIAHTGKDESRGLRGWSGLLANADGVIMLDDPKGEPTRTGTVVKVKDGKAGDRFAFELEPVSLGVDGDGDPVTSCIVVEADAPSGRGGSRKPKLSPKQELVLRSVKTCIDDGLTEPVPPFPGVPHGTLGVRKGIAKERARREGYEDEDAKPDSVRRKLNSHIQDLIGKGALRAQGDLIWPI